MLPRIIFVAAAYLLGSIPFGYLLIKYVFTSGEDVRQIGSGGIGATNVTRRAGRTAGLITYFFDVAKGVAAVMLMKLVAGDDYFWIGAAAVAAIVGTAAVPLWTLLYYGLLQSNPHLKALVIIGIVGCALIVAKHHENINRLIHGTENKIGARVNPDTSATRGGTAVSGGR